MEKENEQVSSDIRAFVLFSRADINSGIVAKLSSAKYGEAAAARDYSGLTMRSERDACGMLEWHYKKVILNGFSKDRVVSS